VTNVRGLALYDGQVYTSHASTSNGGYYGVASVTGGLPTAPLENIDLLAGFPTASGPSPYDMFWASRTTVYVADDRTSGGGIQKWTQSGGVWSLQYTLALSGKGCRSVTGHVVNGVTTLWAVANSGMTTTTSTEVVKVVDTGPGSTVTSIRAAAPITYLRGIRYYGKPPSLVQTPHACSATNIRVTGNGELGTDLITTVTGFHGIPLVSYGVTPLSLPLNLIGLPTCNCTLGHDSILIFVANFDGSHVLPISASWATLGLNVFVQGWDFLLPIGPPCPDLGATSTDTALFTVQ
jgi:hypothetical protein